MGTEHVDQLVADLLASIGVSEHPPIDLARVARALGVDHVQHASIVEDGRLEQRAGRVSVWLRADAPPQRQRFTFAHELGHLVLAEPHRDFVARRMWPGVYREERFCDEFAAALLLPRAWVLENFARRPECLRTARELGAATGASLSASVVRLRELARWRRSLLHWRRYEGRWALASTAGVPRAAHHRVTSSGDTRATLDALAGRVGDRTVTLPLLLAGQPHEVSAEVSMRGNGAVALAALNAALPLKQ